MNHMFNSQPLYFWLYNQNCSSIDSYSLQSRMWNLFCQKYIFLCKIFVLNLKYIVRFFLSAHSYWLTYAVLREGHLCDQASVSMWIFYEAEENESTPYGYQTAHAGLWNQWLRFQVDHHHLWCLSINCFCVCQINWHLTLEFHIMQWNSFLFNNVSFNRVTNPPCLLL